MEGANSCIPLTDRELRNLAPLDLANHRQDRFRGDGNRSQLSEYNEADREILSRTYQRLQSVFEAMLQATHDPTHSYRVLGEHAHQRDLILADTKQLGIATLRTNQSRRLAQVIHDIRGGALLSLLLLKAPVKNLFVSGLTALLVCAVAVLINPYGMDLYAYIPKLFNMPSNKYIIELQPVLGSHFQTTPDLIPFLLLCALYLFCMAREGIAFVRPLRAMTAERQLLACELLICLLSGEIGIWNALQHRRVASFVTLILVGEVIALFSLRKMRLNEAAAADLSSTKVKNRFWSLLDSHSLDLWKAGGIFEMAIIALCAIAGVTLVAFRIAKPELPASSIAFKAPFAAVEFIGKHQPAGKLYNDQQFGDLLVYYLPGKPKVFVDTRFDMYGERLVADYRTIHECEEGWQKLLVDYGIDWAFLDPQSLLAEQLLKDSSWKTLYKDDAALILEHAGEHKLEHKNNAVK